MTCLPKLCPKCVPNVMLSEVRFNKFTIRCIVCIRILLYLLCDCSTLGSPKYYTALQSWTIQINQKVIGYCLHVAKPFQFTINVHYAPELLLWQCYFTPRGFMSCREIGLRLLKYLRFVVF